MGNSNRFDFKRAVDATLNYYLGETAEAISVVIPQVAKEAVQRLKAASPKQEGESKHLYSKNWTYKVEKGRLTCEAIVYGKSPTYRLAHLLEYGHAKVGGGRVAPSPADGHIHQVEEWANDEATDRIIEYLNKNYGA